MYSEESPRGGVGPARGRPEHEQDAPPATSRRRRQGQVKRALKQYFDIIVTLGCRHPDVTKSFHFYTLVTSSES